MIELLVTSPGLVLLWRGYNDGFMTCSSAVSTDATARTTIYTKKENQHTYSIIFS